VTLGAAGWWGILGVVGLIGEAIARLFPMALDLRATSLSALELAVLVGWVVTMVFAEGYRGFHRQFSPRVVARALHLGANPQPLHVVLAPLYCMGLLHATRRRLITSWALTIGIVAIVLLVRGLPRPWRGIVDAGVVAGLTCGVLSIVYFTVRGLRGAPMPVASDVPAPSVTSRAALPSR
jgi:hypothetical protein